MEVKKAGLRARFFWFLSIRGKLLRIAELRIDADPLGTTLVFSSEGETVVTDAAERRDARRRSDDDAVGAATGGSGRRGRGKTVLDLPETNGGKPSDGGSRPN